MSTTATPEKIPALRRESPWRRNLTEFLSSKTAVFGLVIATLLILAAIFAPVSYTHLTLPTSDLV